MTTLDDLRGAGILDAVDVHVARTLARLCDATDEAALLAAALASRAPRLGHVCLDLDAVGSLGPEDGIAPDADLRWPEADAWSERLSTSPLVHDGSGDEPLVLERRRVYLDRYWRYENRLARGLRALASRLHDVPPDVLHRGLDTVFPVTDGAVDRQRLAAALAATRGLTVITGGPGTGKTTTVARLLALLLLLEPGLEVALAAPTGKAAARLEEAIREETAGLEIPEETRHALASTEARTLHRLLGWRRSSTTRFRHDAANPLVADVVVVDEASMASLALVTKLVDALRPEARLVLVGDRDQLASVEAGTVLGDICGPRSVGISAPLALSEEGLRHATAASAQDLSSAVTAVLDQPGIGDGIVHLDRYYRFGPETGIGAVARAIKRDDRDDALAYLRGERTEDGKGSYTDVALVEPDDGRVPESCHEQIVDGYLGYLRTVLDGADPRVCLEAFERQRVLCALRRGPEGAIAMNEQIAGWLAAAEPRLRPTPGTYLGRPIVVTTNDYGVGLYNGDVGVVVRDPDDPERLVAAFPSPDGPRRIALSRVPPHETVFAMSIHKSQGSQFARIFVVLPTVSSPILTRELVYTAITRAREHATLIAPEERLREALERPIQRHSGLPDRLWP